MPLPQHILDALPALPEAERRELAARCAALDVGGPAATKAAGEAEELYGAVRQVFAAQQGLELPPPAVWLRGRYGPTLRKHAGPLVAYARAELQPQGRVGLQKALLLLCGMLYRQLKAERGVSPARFCCALGRIPAIVEQQFPGYRAAGLLPAVLDPQKIAAYAAA